MRTTSPHRLVSLSCCALALIVTVLGMPGTAPAGELTTLGPVPAGDHQVTVTGTSTLHDWKMEGTRIDGEITLHSALAAGITEENWTAAGEAPAAVRVEIPIASIVAEQKKMNSLMLAALATPNESTIRYQMSTATLMASDAAAGTFTVRASGDLTIRGVAKPVAFDVTGVRNADGQITLSGEVPIDMTDFGVKPPVALLGTVKTKPAVTVSFRWVVAPAPHTDPGPR